MALQTRVQDTDPAVLDALYAEPAELLPILSSDSDAYVSTLATILHPELPAASPSRAVVRSHLDFLAYHFLPSATSPSTLSRVAFEKVFFPLLLISKPRHKTARAAWTVLSADAAALWTGALELVAGCLDTWNWETGKKPVSKRRVKAEAHAESELDARTMSKVNIAIAARMSGSSFSLDARVDDCTYLMTEPHRDHHDFE